MNEYLASTNRIYYKQFDRIKMTKDVFTKEIKGAYAYGQLELCQKLLKLVAEKEIKNFDEMVGELQIELHKTYTDCKSNLKLKTPHYDQEKFIQAIQCEINS
jgi:hypothetical protein